MTLYEIIKLSLFGVTLAPVRILAFILILVSCFCVSKLSVIGLSKADLTEPLAPWRLRLQMPIAYLGRLMLFVFGFYWIAVRGKPASRKEAPIVVANHQCMVDGFFFNSAMIGLEAPPTLCSPVAAGENLQIPFLSACLNACQSIIVDRADPMSKKQVLLDIKRRALEAERFGRKVLLFPEGTTSNGSTVIGFKIGAFTPGLPVQPVAIRYPHTHFNPAWVFGPSQPMVVIRMCCQFINFLEVEWLPVYHPTPEEVASPQCFAQNVRKKLAARLGVPVTAHSFDDLRLATAAWALHVPLAEASLEMDKIASMFNVNYSTVEKHLVTFAAMDQDKTGYVTYKQFLQGFALDDSAHLQKMWSIIDKEGNGRLRFKDYFYGLALLNEAGDPKASIQLAFDTFGSESGGGKHMSEADLLALFTFALEIPEATVKQIFREADLKKDGKLSCDEFFKVAKTHPDFIQVLRGNFEGVSQKHADAYKAKKAKKKPEPKKEK